MTLRHRSAAPAILALGTAVPQYASQQRDIGSWMAASFKDQPALQRLVRTIHAYSGIDTRHSCTPEYLAPVDQSPFAPGQTLDKTITTAERMAIYEREAPKLGAAAAQKALAVLSEKRHGQTAAIIDGITHLIVVSCTGFFAPGLDFVIADQLGMPATVKRLLIGFMGCSAAFNGLRTAHEIVSGDPSASVLVICVELCSLHGQPGSDRDLLVAASLFSDGAAAALIGTPRVDESDYFAFHSFHTRMKPNTQDEMIWRIGNYGYELRLSPRIPEHLAGVAPAALEALFDSNSPEFWAIHPGGRAIVDRLAQIFALDEAATHATYDVLRRFGNMSSSTVLFVLEELQKQLRTSGEKRSGVAMAFGPGLVIEMARLIYAPNPGAFVTQVPDAIRQITAGKHEARKQTNGQSAP